MKIEIRLILVLMAVFSSATLFAQEVFQGQITYTLDQTASTSPAAAQAAQEIHFSTDGERSRWEEIQPQGKRIVITDFAAGEEFVLMEFLGKKVALLTPPGALAPMPEKQPRYHEASDKQVFGFKCRQALGSEVWIFSEDVKVVHTILPNPGGLPLAFTLKNKTGNLVYRATSLEQSTPASSAFALPEGYTKVTTDEFRSLFTTVTEEGQ